MLRLIPNIKVNYSFRDVMTACFISSRRSNYTHQLTNITSELLGIKDVILTSSGRSALYHILLYLPQRRVIIPAYTCDVVVEAAKLAGKEIVFAHVNRDTLNIEDIPEVDDNSIFIATHQYGFPCKIKEICAICKQKGAIVIEDCAGALGTRIDGQMAGTFGDYAIFSLNASKLINAPSTGGFLIAKNETDLQALKERISFKSCTFKYKTKNLVKSLAFCFDKNSFVHYWLSKAVKHDAEKSYISAEDYQPNTNVLNDYSYGFYNWQAYVVLKQLKRLPYLMQKREELKDAYNIGLDRFYQSQIFDRQNSCIRYPIYLRDRQKVKQSMREKGVEIGSGFEHFICPDDFVEERAIGREITYLPYSSNYSKKEINFIIKVLNQEANEQSANS